MYKCTDCGQKFEIKPDYCDCGNDQFEEIIEESPKNPAASSIATETNDLPKINSSFVKDAKSIQTKHHDFSLDIPSVLIFISCIILSILAVIYIGKDSLEKMEQARNNPQKTNVALVKNNNIPKIDTIWKDKKITSNTSSKPSAEPKVTTALNNTVPVTAKKQKVNNVITKTIQPKNKNLSGSSVQKNIVKPVSSTNSKIKQTQTKINTNGSATKTAPAKVQSQSVPKKQVVNNVQLQQELANYKIGLRNKLANSINLGKIVGDGFCSVTFKLDVAGNLINRRFSVQSDNDSLNNAVYSALMNNPTYQSPPQGYHNETLTFSVKMYGGRFNITLN